MRWPPCAEHFPSHSAGLLWRGTPFPSFLHLKGLFKGPGAAIDFRTLISRLHYEEFCYLHLRPVFPPPSTLAPPVGCVLIHRRRDDLPSQTHTCTCTCSPMGEDHSWQNTRQRPEQPAGNGDRWRSKCWAVDTKVAKQRTDKISKTEEKKNIAEKRPQI